MPYSNAQGDGLFLVLKFQAGELDTGSYTGSYRHKPACRSYNTIGMAKQMRTRLVKEGYGVRVAEVTVDETGIHIAYIDQDFAEVVDRCKHSDRSGTYGRRIECQLRKGHEGIHWSGIEAKRDPDFNPVTHAQG